MHPSGPSTGGPDFPPAARRPSRRPPSRRAAEGCRARGMALGPSLSHAPGQGPERAETGGLAAGARARVRDGSALGPAGRGPGPSRLEGTAAARPRGDLRGPGVGRPRKLGRGRSGARPAEGDGLPALRKEEEPAPEPP